MCFLFLLFSSMSAATWNLGLYSLLSNLTVKNVSSRKFIPPIWSGLPMRKVQGRDIITNPFKYRAHTLPKYWLKMLFCVSAHSSQIMSKDSFQINCNSLLIPLFFFPPFSTVIVRTPLNSESHLITSMLGEKHNKIIGVMLRLLCSLTQ